VQSKTDGCVCEVIGEKATERWETSVIGRVGWAEWALGGDDGVLDAVKKDKDENEPEHVRGSKETERTRERNHFCYRFVDIVCVAPAFEKGRREVVEDCGQVVALSDVVLVAAHCCRG